MASVPIGAVDFVQVIMHVVSFCMRLNSGCRLFPKPTATTHAANGACPFHYQEL